MTVDQYVGWPKWPLSQNNGSNKLADIVAIVIILLETAILVAVKWS